MLFAVVIDTTCGLAFAKSQLAAGDRLPDSGTVFMSLADRDKATGIEAARRFAHARFTLAATAGTADALEAAGIAVATRVAKVGEATGTDAVELIASGQVQLVVNSPRGRGARADGAHIRAEAAVQGIPCLTTAAAGLAAANGIVDSAHHELRVRTLQEFHRGVDLDRPSLPLDP
jgi:carbamoyl-phosphate synthase large subunit